MSETTYRRTWEDRNSLARATGPRVSAFDDPIHWQQVLTAGTYVVVTIIGIISLAVMFQSSPLPLGVTLGVTILELAVVTGCWLYIELTDPSKPGGIPCSRMAKTQETVAYCSLCRKEVQGLDHHCYFLNTCIGKRNYFCFFAMSLVATVQMALHVVWSILGMTVWREAGNDTPEYYLLVSLQMLVAVAACGGTVSLLGFHIYLLWLGMGTYDWMWKQQADRRQKEQEEARIRFEKDMARQAERRRELQRAEAEAVAVACKPGAAAGGAVGLGTKVHAITVAAVPLTEASEPPPQAGSDAASKARADAAMAFGTSEAATADDLYAEDTAAVVEGPRTLAGVGGSSVDDGAGIGGAAADGRKEADEDDPYAEYRDDEEDATAAHGRDWEVVGNQRYSTSAPGSDGEEEAEEADVTAAPSGDGEVDDEVDATAAPLGVFESGSGETGEMAGDVQQEPNQVLSAEEAREAVEACETDEEAAAAAPEHVKPTEEEEDEDDEEDEAAAALEHVEPTEEQELAAAGCAVARANDDHTRAEPEEEDAAAHASDEAIQAAAADEAGGNSERTASEVDVSGAQPMSGDSVEQEE